MDSVFFHVSEHVDHFKAIKVFSLRKKREMVWLGDNPSGAKSQKYFWHREVVGQTLSAKTQILKS